MKTIDLAPFGRPHPMKTGQIYFVGADHGREVADKVGILAAVRAGSVNIVGIDATGYSAHINVDDGFIKALVGPVIREVGPKEFVKRVRINGLDLNERAYPDRFQCETFAYVNAEAKRLERASKEKRRKEDAGVWSEPVRFYVPDIGTVLKLAKDWTFRLYHEYRNEKMLEMVGVNFSWDSWEKSREDSFVTATIGCGVELTVNRIYIRQGAKEYSSIAFNLGKGAKVVCDGKTFASRNKPRFWAKLADVNRMEVKVDRNTLAEN